MVMDEEGGTGWWLERELVEQWEWIPLSLRRVFLMSVGRWDVWWISQGVKYMAEQVLYYDVAVFASSEVRWWCLVIAKQCLVDTLCSPSLIRPCCAILEWSCRNSEKQSQTVWIMFHKNSPITALSRGLSLLLGVSWKFSIRKFLLCVFLQSC